MDGTEKILQKTITTRTFWTSLIGIVAAIGGFIAAVVLVKDSKNVVLAAQVTAYTAAVSALLGNLGSIFARSGNAEATREVAVRTGIITEDEKNKAEGKAPAPAQ